jgi:uncharacterized protein DUF3558
MIMNVNFRKQSAVLGASIALTMLLGACSGGSTDSTQPSQQTTQAQSGPKISDPKDAKAVELCQLLPADAATALGLNSTGKVDEHGVNPAAPPTCTWESADGATIVSMGPIDGSIQAYYNQKPTFADYQELTIAGYPTVRGNKGNPAQTGNCWMYLGISDSQLLSAFAMSNADPCALTQKALEASVPTLPAAK